MAGLERAKKFLDSIGNPQNKLKIIHVAGTSGKGTTAMLTGSILKAAGFKVGLTLSPHVYDIRERWLINNKPISKDDVSKYLNQLIPAIEKAAEKPSYFEVIIALAFMAFVNQKVDYAVVETGLGGLLDATNTVTRKDKICVLTRIGHDHTQILGKSLSEIATQKAGIIQPNNQVMALTQNSKVNTVLTKRAKQQKAEIKWIKPELIQSALGAKRIFELNNQLWGNFQLENVSLAYAASNYLAQRNGWQLSSHAIRRGISSAQLPGRFEEYLCRTKIIILDGAHNQQKLNALLKAAAQKYPNVNLGIVLAMRVSKSTPVLPAVSEIIATTFREEHQDMAMSAIKPQDLAAALQKRHPNTNVVSAKNIAQAVAKILQSPTQHWLITGSFFGLSEARDVVERLKGTSTMRT